MEQLKSMKAAKVAKVDLMVVDKSYPIFSELLRHDDWKIVHQGDKKTGLFVPVEMKDRRIELMDNMPEPEGDLSPELIEIF